MEALKDKFHGTLTSLHSFKEEAGTKVETFKGDVKGMLHGGHKGIREILSFQKDGSESSSRGMEQSENKFCEYFPNICEKCCAPFSKKND